MLLIPELGKLKQARPMPWPGKPLHLTATSIAQPGSAGTFNAAALIPPNSKPCVLSAIKAQISVAVLGSLVGSNTFIANFVSPPIELGGMIGLSLALAKLRSDGAGPIEEEGEGMTVGRPTFAELCDARNLNAAALAGGFVTTAVLTQTRANTNNPMSEYRWELEKPFYVPAGYAVIPQVFNFGGFVKALQYVSAGNFSALNVPIPSLAVRLSYEGTLLEKAEDYTEAMIHIPYGAGYTANGASVNMGNVNANGAAGAAASYLDVSPEVALSNPFLGNVYVTQMNGKLFWVAIASDMTADAGPSTKVRIAKSSGDPIVRDFSEFRTVFDRQTRAWNMRETPLVLSPGEYVSVAVSGADESIASGQAGIANVVFQPQIGMTGYRDVPRESLEGR